MSMAYTYRPSYSRQRDQEGLGSNPVGANSSRDSISKLPNTKRAGGMVQVIERLLARRKPSVQTPVPSNPIPIPQNRTK
jgi:hypothetical protein